MNRTRALIIIGGFMLALAVLAALELQKDDKVTAEGQMVTGSVDKTAPLTAPLAPPSGGTAASKTADTGSMPETPSGGGVLVPLDNGTLRAPAGGSANLPRVPSAGAPETAGAEKAPQTAALATASTSPAPAGKTAASATQNAAVAAASPAVPPATTAAARPAASASSSASPAPAALATPAASAVQNAPADAARKTAPQAVPGQTRPASAPAAAPASAPSAKAAPATADKSEASAAKKDADDAKPLVLTSKAPAKLQGKQKAITRTRLELGKGITFRLTGAAPLSTKTLLLEGPDRYVVDLQGDWAINLPKVPKNLLLNGVRAGQREEATRLVLELSRKPESAEVVKIDAKTIEIRIR